MIKHELGPFMRDLVQRQGLIAGIFLFLAIVYTLYFAKALLMPIFLAVLAALVLRPLVRTLCHIGIPDIAGAILVTLGLLAVIGWLIVAISGPAGEWIDRAPFLKFQLQEKLEALRGPLEKVQEVTENLQDAARLGKEGQQTVTVEGPGLLARIFIEAQNTLVTIMVVVVLVFFLLARGSATYHRVIAAIEDDERRARWSGVFTSIQQNLARYLLTVALINSVLGMLTAGIMMALGMPNPLLWGVLAGVMNFIPFAGALVTFVIILLVSVLTFNVWLTIILPPLAFLALTILEGQVISPFIVGRQLTLNPIAIFVSVLFWGWLWGFPGMLLAVPILASIKLAISAIDSLEPISAMIDDDVENDIPAGQPAE